MACVYWIRKREHTNVFFEGYIGVTSKTAELVVLVGRSKSVINRYILRYKQEKEASDGS